MLVYINSFANPQIGFGHSEEEVVFNIQKSIASDFENLYSKFCLLGECIQGDVDENDLRIKFIDCRLAYKKVEFIVGYQDNYILRELNGPNLITNVNNFSYSENKNPHGLQLFEELVFEYNSDKNDFFLDEIERTKKLVKQLQKRFEKEVEYDPNFHVLIWDALRLELIRIETMGITGFDVPICKNAIPETAATLHSIDDIIEIYFILAKEKKLKSEFKKGSKLLSNSIEFIEDNDCTVEGFDDFDRMEFTTSYLHPFQKWLKNFTKKMDFVFPTDLRPISLEADHIYSENALNPNYFNTGTSPERIELGQKLFNDSILSGNGERSCASCHQKNKGFGDDIPRNFAFNGDELPRHTPTLWNAVYQSTQFWDSRVTTLEKQAMAVIHNPDEMNGNLDSVIACIKQNQDYVELFEKAYTGYISKHNVVHAINCFIASLKSFDSSFDQYMRGNVMALSSDEITGFNLFMGKAQCATCHFPPLFNGLVPPFYTESESEIIGVPFSVNDQSILDPDSGRYNATGLAIHLFAFKTPGLRNIGKTAPYMHNGVFEDLDQVMDFYNEGGGVGKGQNLPNQTLPHDPLNLSQKEIDQIIAFLNSLSSE